MFILSGFENKERVEVSIVSTSITKQGLRYDIKLKFTNCNEVCKKNLNLKVKPEFDLRNLMELDGRELLLIRGSKHIDDNTGKYFLEYKVKKNVSENEVFFFSKYATLLVMDGTKIIQKVSLKKYRNKTLSY